MPKKKSDSSIDNVALVRRLLDGILEPSHIDLYEDFFSQTIRLHGPMRGEKRDYSISTGKKFDARLAATFKKRRMDIQQIFSYEDKVVAYWVLYAARRDDGKEIIVSGMSMYRIQSNKIREIWQSWDRLGLLEQVGEVRVCSNLVELEPNYDTLKKFGMEKYAEYALHLSKRERQCLTLFLEGKTAKETAQVMKLSFRTIESYFENIKIKLHCHTKRDLLKMAQTLSKLSLL